ncbi:hypothetical protein [Ferruginibacter sp.]|nr:hypothetical protein [Ferruginibacter sp.]
MSLLLEACIEFNEKRKICVAYENGKTYTLNNNSNVSVRKVKIDKCLAQNVNEKRCDFLFDTDELQRVFFVELKGGDLNKAVNQIYSTILYLKSEFRGFRIDARIVGSRDVPEFKNTPDYKRLAKEVYATKGTIERGINKVYSETI